MLAKFAIYISILANFHLSPQGAGIITQVTVVYRAKQYFNGNLTGSVDYNKILNGNYDAIIAGSIFPDAFRECAGGQYKHISEDSHYGGFLNASINYIRNHYPQPWSRETEKLVAFLFGIASNQVSTMLWESIGIDQGFVRTLANVNFHGSYKDARKAADFGADSVVLVKSQVDYLHAEQQWYFPVDDLFKIYLEYYGSVKIPADVIDNCTTLQVLKAFVEVALLTEAYTETAAASPFLVDQTKDYFLGGINDMAAWTQRIWSNTIKMLQNGTTVCDVTKNTLFINCNKQRNLNTKPYPNEMLTDFIREQPLLPGSGMTMDDVVVIKSKQGKYIKAAGKLQDLLHNLKKSYAKTKIKRHKTQGPTAPQYLYYSNQTFSELGWSMAAGDVDGDGNEDLVAGAPVYSVNGDFQQGRVYIIYANGTGLNRKNQYYWEAVELNVTSTTYFSGPSKTQSRYGSAVALLDINLDGILDLAVGASSYSNEGYLGYNGIVYIYFGKYKSRLVQDMPDITITCQIANCNLGFSMTVTDFDNDGNNDLIIGTPFYSKELNQSGIVSGLPSSSAYKGPSTIAFEDLIRKFSLTGKQEYSWFGYSVTAKDNVLMVSQPYYRKCGRQDCKISSNDTQAIGAVAVHNFGTKLKTQGFSYLGDKEFDMAGAGADIGFPYKNGTPVFAVGVPGASVYGSVFGIPFHYRQGGSVLLYDISGTDIKLVANFDGDRMYERFGKCVLFEDVNGDGVDDLVFSAPERFDLQSVISDHREDTDGIVYTFYGGNGFPSGNQTHSSSICTDTFPCPEKLSNMTSHGLDEVSQFGDVLIALKNTMTNSLIISSRLWEYYYGGRMAGVTATPWNHTLGHFYDAL